ncbi:MAG: DUF4430 domain-containing protein [Candidatus Levybacteria bacterium]|nr:DUF4430 domain-containing protein [Candidatus Levybacteria bacterium]
MVNKDKKRVDLTPIRRLKLSLLSGFLFVIIIGVMFTFSHKVYESGTHTNQKISEYSQKVSERDYFSYQGTNGKDALEMLQKLTNVQQDSSGLVISINGRRALSDKREYWSFFVNVKMAEVGTAEYQTSDKDFIEWRIQKY